MCSQLPWNLSLFINPIQSNPILTVFPDITWIAITWLIDCKLRLFSDRSANSGLLDSFQNPLSVPINRMMLYVMGHSADTIINPNFNRLHLKKKPILLLLFTTVHSMNYFHTILPNCSIDSLGETYHSRPWSYLRWDNQGHPPLHNRAMPLRKVSFIQLQTPKYRFFSPL